MGEEMVGWSAKSVVIMIVRVLFAEALKFGHAQKSLAWVRHEVENATNVIQRELHGVCDYAQRCSPDLGQVQKNLTQTI